MGNEMKPQLGNFKDELFLITLVVLAGGIIYVDAYYQAFGIKFESLDISTMIMIYRGLLMADSFPLIFLPYLFTLVVLGFEIIAIRKNYNWFLEWRTITGYVIILINFVLIYTICSHAGFKVAKQDIETKTSKLPKILKLSGTYNEIKAPKDNYRLLVIDKDYIYIFSTTDNLQIQVPVMERIPKSSIKEFKTQL